ncbi:hypothetical protein Poli38472_004931 [Pythium oligandrum]|uniref:Uncharacterized protein n=1 Tax=Pythium oligandrum TaxID=41045 RepID=A0A8K1CCL1_PYTOL|nr:hypothetical protein Poli38472_004931 [Pythium oligandrum]|eukprot:TMW59862.1 hypothetical protein Poli38472_004931 [Pythium oligandrum]
MNWLELQLDDDPETLRAALELIDSAADAPIDAEDAGDHTTSDSVEEKHGREELHEPTQRTSLRRKKEIQQLQHKVTELETTLSNLRNTERGVISAKELTSELVWKDIALRQRKQRCDAETENERLTAMLHAQTVVGKQLLHLLHYTTASQSEAARIAKEPPRDSTPTEEQYRHLDELFAESESVFASERFNTPKPSFQDLRVLKDGTKGMVIDTFAAWVVPFEASQVADALWGSMTHYDDSKMCKSIQMNVETKDDTLIASFTISNASIPDGTYGYYSGTSLGRRYRSDDGSTLIVSMMSGEMVGSTPTSQDHIGALEVQWMRIRPIQSIVETESAPIVQVQLNRQIRLTFPTSHSAARRSIVGAVIELLLLQVEDDITRKQEMVERLMFQARA